MNIFKPSKPTDQSQSVSFPESQEQVCETVPLHAAPAREPQSENGSEIGPGDANVLLRQIAGTTFKEIDRLIDELHAMRDHLQDEGLRVQREIVKYAQLSQAAMKSTKIIAEGMTHLHVSAERFH